MVMQLIDAIIHGIVQGLSEFIPVSSSGHLIVVGHFLNFQHSGLAFDTALDIGTLAALYLFFARDFYDLGHDLIFGGPKRMLAIYILIATIPAVVAGLLLQHYAETVFRSSRLVAVNLILVGILMYIIDRYSRLDKQMSDFKIPQALSVGIAQALALVPGVSRSGITITTGRFLGFDRVAATRFSFLLSAPIITGATLKVLIKPDNLISIGAHPLIYIAGILAAFISGWFSIRFLIGYLSRHGLGIFAGYRICVGILILGLGLR
jgi:undecaprenyl-diphosphatase